ncbi:MAG: hypothetical protein IH840_07325 [Candidatus Heimdallarchaeota archaeon]|nr:hypothetical protein [Candidatus Heimdallarchaeota archaeon]
MKDTSIGDTGLVFKIILGFSPFYDFDQLGKLFNLADDFEEKLYPVDSNRETRIYIVKTKVLA